MAGAVMGGFLDRVLATVGDPDDPRSDAELLRDYGGGRDPAAFVILVRRYGPLVWAVCRRVTGDPHAAEDAFQATFLVLARKADQVRPRHSAGGWLHRTATHVALKARAMTVRRREDLGATLPDRPVPESPRPDPVALAALDQEIDLLPEGLRAAVVLCELRGVPRRVAATELRVPEGTLSSRLAAARRTLAARLRRRGIDAAGGIGILLTAGCAAVAGPPARLPVAASAMGNGNRPPAVSAVSALADMEIRAMFLTRLFSLAAGAGVLGLALAGLWLIAPGTAASFAPVSPPTRPPAPPREGVLVLSAFGSGPALDVRTPDGDEVCAPSVGGAAVPRGNKQPPACSLWGPRLSPNGREVIALQVAPAGRIDGKWTVANLWLFDVAAKDGPADPLMTELRAPAVAWAPDGKTLFGSNADPGKLDDRNEKGKPVPMVNWALDPVTKKRTDLRLPAGHAIVDVSPDGRTFLTVVRDSADIWSVRSYLVGRETLKSRPLTEKEFTGLRFSSNGKAVFGYRKTEPGAVPAPLPLGIVTISDGVERPIPLVEGADFAYYACWSPDGRRVAYRWSEPVPQPKGAPIPVGGGQFQASRVTVSDLDGRNAKTVVRREYDQSVTGLDWR
jgi:RNA polymerase sigma factor (sigma-70 family)